MAGVTERLDGFLPLGTRRLHIRQLDAEDAPALSAMTNDPRITGVVHFLPDDFTPAEALRLIDSDDSGRDHYLGAWLTDSHELVAMIGVHFRDSGETEIGYWVKADLHGQGIATEAVSAIIGALVSTFPERRLIAECRTANIPSWKLLEKLGFEGTEEKGERPGRMRLVFNTNKD